MSRRAAAALVTAAVLLGACGGSGAHSGGGAGSTSTSAPTAAALAGVRLSTAAVVNVDSPTALAARPGTTDLFVAEKAGAVQRIVVDKRVAGSPVYHLVDKPVLDLTSKVADSGEQGLLGLVFSADGSRLYVFTTLVPDGRTSIAAYDMRADDTADPTTRRELLSIPRRYTNHNGGQLALGPDGYLYIGIGDGGSEGDPDHHGQDTSTLFAKILRIDPSKGSGYAIPAGNPFEHGGGKPEIWLSGVRNPWRFSFDRADGDLWIGDVGQDTWEEVDRLPATAGRDAGRGANLGWSLMEATHPHQGGVNPPDGVLPIFEYRHDEGCSITGGYVYRGSAIPALQGAYLFADYCGQGIRALVTKGATVVGSRSFALPVSQVQSFGEDADGELYVLPADGHIVRLVSAG